MHTASQCSIIPKRLYHHQRPRFGGPLLTEDRWLQTSGTQGVDMCFGIKGPAGRRAGDVEVSRFFESDTGERAGGLPFIVTASGPSDRD